MNGFDETFDWVVVGSGAGAMVSALVMHQAAKSVLVLEKCSQVGGTTAKSGGMLWIPNNRFMHEAGDGDSTESAMQYLDALCENLPGSTREKRLAYVVEGPKMVDFLVGCGVELERASAFWPDYYDELPGGVKTSRSVVAKPFDKKRLGAWETAVHRATRSTGRPARARRAATASPRPASPRPDPRRPATTASRRR